MAVAETITALAPLIAGGLTVVSGARFIQQGERGIKLRFGKPVCHKTGPRKGHAKVVHPGFTFLVPKIDNLRRIHVRQFTINFPTQTVMLSDNTVFEFGGMLKGRIGDNDDDIFRAIFETDNLRTSTTDYCLAVLRDVVSKLTHADLHDTARISAEIQEKVVPQLQEWGVCVDLLKLTDCSPTAATERLVLIQTEAAFRTNAMLTTLARIAEEPSVRHLNAAALAAGVLGSPVAINADAGSGFYADDDEEDHNMVTEERNLPPKIRISVVDDHH